MIKKFFKCSYKALVDTIYHDGIEHAGYLAFLALLSLFPFLVFFGTLVSFFGQSELGLQLLEIILAAQILPDNVKNALGPHISEIITGPPQGLLTLAIVGAIWTSSSAVEGLRTILNRAYRVSTPPAYIWRRLMSIIQFFILTLVVMGATTIFIIFPAIWDQFVHLLEIEELQHFTIHPSWDYFRYGITTLLLFLTVCALYLILPNIKQSFRVIFPGALYVVALWFLSGILFSMYLQHFDQVHILYGSLAGIIAALLFFYFTAMIFIYGAEFNYNFDRAIGVKIEPKE